MISVKTSSIILIFVVFSVSLVSGSSNSFRRCPLNNEFDEFGTKEKFMYRCDEKKNSLDVCERAWDIFSSIWNTSHPDFNSSSTLPDYTPFINYFNWTEWMIINNRTPMLYAGSGQCPDLAHRVSNVSTKYITLEDQSGPYFVGNTVWCEEDEFDNATHRCSPDTVWGGSFGGAQGFQGGLFWIPASAAFGASVYNDFAVLLKSFEIINDGQVTKRSAFSFTTTFGRDELPSILSRNPKGFTIIIISNIIQPEETCNNGSLYQLANYTTSANIPTKCVVDPPCLLEIVCNPVFWEINPQTNISNLQSKCDYFNKLVEYDPSQRTNCDCSTGFIDNLPANPNQLFCLQDIPSNEEKEITSPKDNVVDEPWFVAVVVVASVLVIGIISALLFVWWRRRSYRANVHAQS